MRRLSKSMRVGTSTSTSVSMSISISMSVSIRHSIAEGKRRHSRKAALPAGRDSRFAPGLMRELGDEQSGGVGR